MIDKGKFQVEVLKDMLSDKRMKRIDVSEDEVGITDGYHIVVFQKSNLKIRWEDLPILQYNAIADPDMMEQIFDSNIRKRESRMVIAKLWSKDKRTISLVNEKFLSNFRGCEFFSNGGTSTVFVYDGIGSLVGLILPIRGEDF